MAMATIANLGYPLSATKVPKQRWGSSGVTWCHQAAGLTAAFQQKQELEAVAASSMSLHGPAIWAFFSETSSVPVSQPHTVVPLSAQLAMSSLGLGSNMSLTSSASVPPALPFSREWPQGSSAKTLEL